MRTTLRAQHLTLEFVFRCDHRDTDARDLCWSGERRSRVGIDTTDTGETTTMPETVGKMAGYLVLLAAGLLCGGLGLYVSYRVGRLARTGQKAMGTILSVECGDGDSGVT